ncbi:MAG: Hsp20 family protein, partial [Candidatus Nitrosotenuis sp.]
ILHDDSLIIIIDIPGFDKKDIKLSIHKNILSINAHRPDSKNEKIIYKISEPSFATEMFPGCGSA